MPVRGFDHVAITVSDTRRSLEFYCGLLGLEQVEQHQLAADDVNRVNGAEIGRGQSTRLVAPHSPGILIDFLEYFEQPKGGAIPPFGRLGSKHFCLSVKDLQAMCRELSQNGVRFVSEPVTFSLENGPVDVVFLHDPDGNAVELVEEYTLTLCQ